MLTFQHNFWLGSNSYRFILTGSKDVSLNGNMYDFSVECNSTDKSDILLTSY